MVFKEVALNPDALIGTEPVILPGYTLITQNGKSVETEETEHLIVLAK